MLTGTSTEDETTHRFLGNRLWFTRRKAESSFSGIRSTGARRSKALRKVVVTCTSATTTTKTIPAFPATCAHCRCKVSSAPTRGEAPTWSLQISSAPTSSDGS